MKDYSNNYNNQTTNNCHRMMHKAIIFDLYNTLLHVTKNNNVYLRFLRELKISNISEALKIILTENFIDLASVAKRLGKSIYNFDLYENLIEEEIDSVVLYSDTLETLQKIKSKNIPIAVISNLSTPYCEPFYRYGLDSLVDDYIFSCCVGYAKPQHEIYNIIIERWSLPPDKIIMIGDSYRSDFLGAKSAGLNAILLDRNKPSNFSDNISSLLESCSFFE